MHGRRHLALMVALCCGLAGFASEAHAYLDPSSGSMILSAVVGLFATLGLAVKTYWYKLKNLLNRRGPQGQPATRATSSGEAAGSDSAGQESSSNHDPQRS